LFKAVEKPIRGFIKGPQPLDFHSGLSGSSASAGTDEILKDFVPITLCRPEII
jgi:hypothetical protein